jgi:hypothetical protein
MQPMLATFIRLTLVIALAIAIIALAGWLFHVVVIAAVIAAVVVGGVFLYNMIRGRAKTPAIRQ